jgi:tetratricopeptide (TPR) repeat protein
MEFLKKTTTILLVASFWIGIAHAQTSEQIINAFKKSYVSESKSDFNSAINELQKAYREDSYECNLRMGWLNYNALKYTASMEYYQKAINLKKFSVEARFGFIKPAYAAKEYAKVYEKYTEILKIDPYNSIANYWIGYSYYAVKNYEVAAKYFELIVNMYPFDYDANHMLAWTYLNLGRVSDAKILFEKALLYKPTDKSSEEGLLKCK